ncbi:hypothetical protein TRFO_23374 [Tritrichomonas foetus]|uniref:Uncharacterized protein n=1 Tax=Tritrichomonas foetus TaxID=1144522 RepID=A0A1J4K9M9_9EUKA|nr:hypothetical protein TRFO_23374 [Tritrichomonas foetus]|eukprot:OHT08169.1 hypothetical protein TRFO_23374 [Tritrichomonas foetus]
MNENDPAKLPAINRWSRPGFIKGVFGKKADEFAIARGPTDNNPITLNFGNANLIWEDGHWKNLNFNHQPQALNPSKAEIKKLQKENAELQVQCEILLHMLTVSEMSKIKAQTKLNDLKAEITRRVKTIEREGEQ